MTNLHCTCQMMTVSFFMWRWRVFTFRLNGKKSDDWYNILKSVKKDAYQSNFSKRS